GGLVGSQWGDLTNVYSTGAATSAGFHGALAGYYTVGNITNAYWDSTTAGASGFGFGSSSGAQGLPTATLKAALPSGFSTAFWGIVPNTTYPYLLFQPGVVTGTVYASYGGAASANVTVS